MPYSLKPDNDVLCQCGCIVKKYYMPTHLQTIKHACEMQGHTYVYIWAAAPIQKYMCGFGCVHERNVAS